jgi:Peptidase family M23
MAPSTSSDALRMTRARYVQMARLRGAAMRVAAPLVFGGLVLIPLARDVVPPEVIAAVVLLGVGAFLVSVPVSILPIDVKLEPRPIDPPVRGRWQVLNSPGTKVPSHGTNAYGQTYAFDLLYEPHDGARPEPRGLGLDRPERFPTFGQDVLAPADATVVSCSARMRDHRCRARLPSYIFVWIEAYVRELFGVRFMFGNHLVLDLGDGVYAGYAHLQRGSVRVRPGDRVRAGEPVARAGNSGNTTEPHLHFQLMDHPKPMYAAGLPFELPAGIPPNGEHLDTALADREPAYAV